MSISPDQLKRPTSEGRPSPQPVPLPRRVTYRAAQWVRQHIIALLIGALLLWLVAAPILLVINMSFRGGTPANQTAVTLDNYAAVYGDSLTYSTLLNTVIYATAVTLVSLTLAALFAWLVERTDMPGRNLIWIAMLIPLAMPGMLSAMSWILLGAPNIGLVNITLRGLLGFVGIDLETGPFNIYSLYGMIWVEGLKGTSTLFLMLVGAFRLMDQSLEEAATVSGASKTRTIRQVTLPLMLPALLAAGIYAFLGNLEDFDIPLILGLQANVFILPTLIYFKAYISPVPDWGVASAYTSIFLLIMLILVAYYYIAVVGRSRRYATITGKGYRPKRVELGRWRWAALGSVLLYFFFAILLPLAVLAYASLLPSYQGFTVESLGQISLENYVEMFNDHLIANAVKNTVILAIVTATMTMLIAFLVSWVVIRIRVKGGLLMDAMAFAPNAIPAVAIGLGIIIFYLHPAINWLPIYGTLTIIIIALGTKYLAFTTRLGNSAMLQVSQELEEAAWTSGAGRLRGFARITMPLLLPTFIAGWLWVAAHAVRNLTLPLLLATPRTETVSMRMYIYWERNADFPLTSAMGVFLIAALMVAAFFSRKIILRGFSGP